MLLLIHMVKKINELYQCDECKLLYSDISWAKRCEEWCKSNNSCNLEIIRHSIKKMNDYIEE